MNKRLVGQLFGVLMLLGLSYSIVAGRGRFSRSFYKKLGKSELAVAMFYWDGKVKKMPNVEQQLARFGIDDTVDKEKQLDRLDDIVDNKIDRLEDMFDYTSEDDVYEEIDIAFIQANIAKERYANAARDFGITVTEPTFVLFKDSVPLKDKTGALLVLSGYDVTRLELKNFINTHFAEDIKRILKEQAEIRKRKLEEAKIRRMNWAPYWGGYYPNYYWAGPYWRSRYYW